MKDDNCDELQQETNDASCEEPPSKSDISCSENKNTRRANIKAGRTFRQYLEGCGCDGNFETLSAEELNKKLEGFYVNVRTNDGQKYKMSSLESVRHSLNRYLKAPPYCRPFDIIKDPEFISSNSHYKCAMYNLKAEGKAIEHYALITPADLRKIFTTLSTCTPSGLQAKVQFDIRFYFCRKGLNKPRTMTKQTFEIQAFKDTGRRFVSRVSDNIRDVNESDLKLSRLCYMPEDLDSDYCPVKSFEKMFIHLHPMCNKLWQSPAKDTTGAVWFHNKGLGKEMLDSFMGRLSAACKLSRVYNNQSLHATGIELIRRNRYAPSFILMNKNQPSHMPSNTRIENAANLGEPPKKRMKQSHENNSVTSAMKSSVTSARNSSITSATLSSVTSVMAFPSDPLVTMATASAASSTTQIDTLSDLSQEVESGILSMEDGSSDNCFINLHTALEKKKQLEYELCELNLTIQRLMKKCSEVKKMRKMGSSLGSDTGLTYSLRPLKKENSLEDHPGNDICEGDGKIFNNSVKEGDYSALEAHEENPVTFDNQDTDGRCNVTNIPSNEPEFCDTVCDVVIKQEVKDESYHPLDGVTMETSQNGLDDITMETSGCDLDQDTFLNDSNSSNSLKFGEGLIDSDIDGGDNKNIIPQQLFHNDLLSPGIDPDSDTNLGCDQCPLTFKSLCNLKKHKRKVHHGPKLYDCDICSQSFRLLSERNLHRDLHIHEMVNPYICSVCDEAFREPRHLIFHSKIHNQKQAPKSSSGGVNSDSVVVKQEADRLLSNLTVYEQTMTLIEGDASGESPDTVQYVCSKCTASFSSSETLKKHDFIMHRYDCNLCNQSFRLRSELSSHMVVHQKTPYVCSECDERFSTPKALIQHSKQHEIQSVNEPYKKTTV